GPTGTTGPTGATGPLITANNGTFFNPNSTNVSGTNNTPGGGPVPLTNNGNTNGGFITHIPPSPDITLAPNQTYYVSYSTDAQGLNVTETFTTALFLDGVEVPGSRTTSAVALGSTGSIQLVNSNGVIVNTGAIAQILQLRLLSATNKNLINTTVSVIKLA
ncbi:collagen-like protein, partial [Bacillus cereus]|nr:collagen-like protein [Bacillus cereus]